MPNVTVHLIRHAQGFHNVGVEYHGLLDPRLTPLGETQCAKLQAAHFPPSRQSRISLITASPLTRTLNTAYLTFRPLLDATHPNHQEATSSESGKGKLRKPEILALPDAQETSDFPCDTGSEPGALAAFLKDQGWPVDLGLLSPEWTDKALGSRYSPHSDAIMARARDTRILLREKAVELLKTAGAQEEDIEIVLVTHGAYLHYFTGDWEDATTGLGTGWKNCETRAYRFEAGVDDLNKDVDAKLVETIESRERRGKTGPQASWEEQEELFELAMQGWEKAGLQRPDRIGMEGVEWRSGLDKKKQDEKDQLQKKGEEGMGPGLRLVESQDMPTVPEGVVEEGLKRERSASITIRARA